MTTTSQTDGAGGPDRGSAPGPAPLEPATAGMPGADWLRSTLTLRQVGEDRFAAPTPGAGRRLFGGQVLAQGLLAAAATVDPTRPVHSLHAYFVRGGLPGRNLVMEVTRTRDGGSFSTRHVTAVQGGLPILEMMASFHRQEPGADWQFGEPVDVPGPAACPSMSLPWPGGSAFDVRPAVRAASGPVPHPVHPFWIRLRSAGVDDGGRAAAMLVYLSDIALMGVARAPGVDTDFAAAASLDHAVWFHRPATLTDWLLYTAEPVVNRGARGLARGSLLTGDGALVASVTQEALLRVAGPPSPAPDRA